MSKKHQSINPKAKHQNLEVDENLDLEILYNSNIHNVVLVLNHHISENFLSKQPFFSIGIVFRNTFEEIRLEFEM